MIEKTYRCDVCRDAIPANGTADNGILYPFEFEAVGPAKERFRGSANIDSVARHICTACLVGLVRFAAQRLDTTNHVKAFGK